MGTPKIITLIVLKREQSDFTKHGADGIANCVDSDQTAPHGAV